METTGVILGKLVLFPCIIPSKVAMNMTLSDQLQSFIVCGPSTDQDVKDPIFRL